MKKTAELYLEVTYDDEKTDPEALAGVVDTLLKTANSPGLLDEYGNPEFGECFVELTEEESDG